jgi:hypothetical protein
MNDSPRWSLNNEKTKLRVDFPTNPATAFELSTEEVDAFIASLSDMRASMTPSVLTSEPGRGTKMRIAPYVKWWVEKEPDRGTVILALAHPGLRWVGMSLKPEEARQLIDRLSQQLRD